VTITVTATNGESATYEFTVRVGGASADTNLTSLTLNDVEVTDGQTIELPARTTSVNVVAVPRDEAASIRVTGKTGLKVGLNVVEIEVTAPDQVAKRIYTLNVVVAPLSSNTNLSSFKVNGEDVTDGSTVQLPALTRQVTVDAITADPEATVAISGRNNLADGTNTLSVAVTAADGTVRTYLVTLNVRILSGDKSLALFKINGNNVQNGDVVTVENGTESVEVEAVANSEAATVEIIGGNNLATGDNFVSALVTAENGSSQIYRVNVKVAQSSVKTLSTFKVAGQDVVDGAELVLPQYTKFVSVQVATTDANARFTIQGATGLVSGDNQLSVVVTAADGSQATYTVKLYVTPLSSDTGLKVFKINGVDVVDKGISFAKAMMVLRNYLGKNFKKAAFIVFGNHDARILHQSFHHSPDALETTVKTVTGNLIDYSMFLSEFIKDQNGNPLSLINNLLVFKEPFQGEHHQPLDDAKNLMLLYRRVLENKETIMSEYLKIFKQFRHLPEPVKIIIQQLLDDKTVEKKDLMQAVKDYLG
jgi:inhibitor of KinA sporulation pathway (predicted exonuclease)